MQNHVAIGLMKRALIIAETQKPELADANMRVPLDYYNDEHLFAKERALFFSEPLALLAASEIAQPHDYYVRQALGRSVLLTRDEQGKAHAFLNYCRHRGAEPARGCGNARAFSCPYHAWRYDARGRLIGMPLRERYDGLDVTQLGLIELPSQERHGFIWVVMTPGHPIDVSAHLGPLDAELAALGVDKMTYYNALPHERLEANWKTVAEGLLEGLHVPHVHPGTFALNPQASNVDLAFYDGLGAHIRYGMPMFGKDQVAQIRAKSEADWNWPAHIGCIWLISPGLLLAHELYGLIYADLTPGAAIGEAYLRYGWLSPATTPPKDQPSPEAMAARAAVAVRQDAPVWAGCGRGLSRGEHGFALIGRNEKGIQLFHEQLARRTGYSGLRYC